LVTGPTEEPITLDEAKDHLRVDGTDEDALIMGLIKAARVQCELHSRRRFVTQTWELGLACWPAEAIVLPGPPLQSVTWLKYTTSAGVQMTLASGDYVVDTLSEPGRVLLGYGKCWPTVTLQPGPAIRVRYVAGYGAPYVVPETYKQAIRLLVGHYYENREAVTVAAGVTATALPMAVDSLLMMDRGGW
jgi:uncharacterized phiE125 gp8 family phage protein